MRDVGMPAFLPTSDGAQGVGIVRCLSNGLGSVIFPVAGR